IVVGYAQRPPSPPTWFEPAVAEHVLRQAGDGLRSSALDLVQVSGLDQLLAWIQRPDVQAREQLARWIPTLAVPRATLRGTTSLEVPLARVALDVLDGGALGQDGPATTMVWHHGALALALRMTDRASMTFETAVVLDDATDVLGEAHRQDWRAWLHLANLLNHRMEATTITTRTLVAAAVQPASGEALGDDDGRLESAQWDAVFADAVDVERDLLRSLSALAEAGVAPPVLGEEAEVDDELMVLDLSWPAERVAVFA